MIAPNDLFALGFEKSDINKDTGGKLYFKKDGREYCLCFPCNFFAMIDGNRYSTQYKIRLNDANPDKVAALLKAIETKAAKDINKA